ncbi:MAG: TIM barrel protein [Clostridiales bacterium]|nr:TIM barrel protein [Clostridiales bacterium]
MKKYEIGAMFHYRAGEDIRARFKLFADNDLNVCQMGASPSLYTKELAAEIKAASEEFGIRISGFWPSVSGPAEWNFVYGPVTIGLVPPGWRGIRIAEVLRASEFAEWLGVTDITMHVGFLPENPGDPLHTEMVGALRYIARSIAPRGQYFNFETGQETPVVLLRMIQEIGLPNLGINLDSGNLILYGKANPADAVDVFGKYVRNTHIKDGLYPTDGRSLGREVPFGEGRVNFPVYIRRLVASGYTGPFVVEREISGEKQLTDILTARDGILKILAEIEEENAAKTEKPTI